MDGAWASWPGRPDASKSVPQPLRRQTPHDASNAPVCDTEVKRRGRILTAERRLFDEALAEASGAQLPAEHGLLVARLTRGGPAEDAGILGGRSVAVIGNQEYIIGGDLMVDID